jgi:hypothetical protein
VKRSSQLSLPIEELREPPEPERAPWNLRRDDLIPDVRDGLTRAERVVLVCLAECEKEKRGRMVSTAMLYGRVVEHVNLSVPEFQRILQRLVGVR